MSNTTNNKTEKWPAYEYKGEIVKLGNPGDDHDPTNGWQPETEKGKKKQKNLMDYQRLTTRESREKRIKLWIDDKKHKEKKAKQRECMRNLRAKRTAEEAAAATATPTLTPNTNAVMPSGSSTNSASAFGSTPLRAHSGAPASKEEERYWAALEASAKQQQTTCREAW